jgi:hypothetical protein
MIEPDTCRALLKAIEDVQMISMMTNQGLVDDHCENALVELNTALKILVNEWVER